LTILITAICCCHEYLCEILLQKYLGRPLTLDITSKYYLKIKTRPQVNMAKAYYREKNWLWS